MLHQAVRISDEHDTSQKLSQRHRQPWSEGAVLKRSFEKAKDQPNGEETGGGESDSTQSVDDALFHAPLGQLRQNLIAEGLIVLPDDLRRGLAPGLPLLEHVQNVPVDQLLLVGVPTA